MPQRRKVHEETDESSEGGKRGAATKHWNGRIVPQWARCRTNKVHRSAAPFRSGEKENLARDPSSARSGIPRSAAAIREKNGDWTNCVPVDRTRQPNLTRRPREDRALTWCLLRTTGGDDTDNKVLPRARLGRAPVGRARSHTFGSRPRGLARGLTHGTAGSPAMSLMGVGRRADGCAPGPLAPRMRAPSRAPFSPPGASSLSRPASFSPPTRSIPELPAPLSNPPLIFPFSSPLLALVLVAARDGTRCRNS